MLPANAIAAALTSTALISLAPNLILVLFPNYASGEGETSRVLLLGQCVAAGGLLGDVFLHTVPHSSGGHDAGMWLLAGFSIFFIADMIIRSLEGDNHSSHGHVHHNRLSHGEQTSGMATDATDKTSEECSREGSKVPSATAVPTEQVHPTISVVDSAESAASTVLLNLVADAMHNFTDGIAIGASFAVAYDDTSFSSMLTSRGGLATLSILFHEIPHELGDFAVLVKGGFSKRQAIVAQFGTAVAATIGTVVGLLAAAGNSQEQLLFGTAGGFVYLSCVSILPEVLSTKSDLSFRMLQLACFGLGVGFLYAVALMEDMDGQHHGYGHSHAHHDHHDCSHPHHQEMHHDSVDHHEHHHDHHHEL